MPVLKSLIIFAVLIQFSCNDCRLVDCEGDGGLIKLRLLRNGQNALYGPESFIDKDSIKAYVITDFVIERNVGFLDTFKSIVLFVDDSFPVILEVNGIAIDTLSVTSEVVGMGECCIDYQLTSVSRNGQEICSGSCEEIIDIEI